MTGFARVMAMAATALLGMSFSLDAAAQHLTTQQYRNPKSANDLKYNRAYLMGVADGLIAYNTSAESRLFCPPGLIPKIGFEEANNLVMRYAHQASGAADLPVGRVLLFGLRQAYPCRR